MRTTLLSLGVLAFTLAAAAGCESTDPGGDPSPACGDAETPGCLLASDKQRLTPDVPAADLDALVAGNTTFALNLHHQLEGESGNLFYSPHSISMALAMAWAGARGNTEADMATALGFKLTQDQTHAAFNSLDQALASRGQGAQGADGKGFRLNIANAMWAQMGFPFEATYLDTLALNYGAGVHLVDFVDQTKPSIDLINGWVSDRTEGKIEEIVNEQVVTTDTRFVLTNTIYFNAAWETPFDEDNTKDGTFTLLDGGAVTAPMMHGGIQTSYVDGDGYQAAVLPYDGHELSMVVVMPDAGGFSDFEASLDPEKLDDILGSMGGYMVDLTMPRFKFSADFNLSAPLKALGMESAFVDADFSGMSSEGLEITDVVHSSFVSVNEAGTEAAAATAVIGGTTSAPEPATLTLDHPFLFFIRDNPTGAVLFVGRIQDPTQ